MKNCPFCGERAATDKIEKIVYCVGCGVEFKADLYHSLDEMVERWNSRITSQPDVEADAKCSVDFHKEEYLNGSTFCRVCGARIRTA